MAESRELMAYLNGRVVPHGQVVAEMSETAAEPEPGFYDAERTFGGQVFKLREHLQRLYRSLEYAAIDPGRG
jgi:branched-chain amino acid aminotransferase